MAKVVIAELIIPPEVEAEIRQKPNHNLTGVEVREAVRTVSIPITACRD